jgi:ankyrin repeat protein
MASYELHRAVKNADIDRINEILSGSSDKAQINQPDHKGRTPLMYAIDNREAGIEILQTLIRHGAVIDTASVCCALSDLQKLTALIEAGADLLYQDEHGYDALINAAYGRDVLNNPQLLGILNLLIEKGVSLRGMTTYDESAVRVLSRIGRFDAVQFLLKAGANPDDVKLTPLIEAVAFGSLADVAAIVESGANLEERDYWERTSWLFAIQTGDISKARYLLDHGADRNARGRCKKPPLHYAIESDLIPMLEWLIEIGIDIEQTDQFGDTPLRTAVDYSSDRCVDVLLRAGANANHESKTGSALGDARSRGIVLKLLNAGADPQHLSSGGVRAILGFPVEPDLDLLGISADEFQLHRSRRFGERNPEAMNNPFWQAMIRSGVSASEAGGLFEIGEKIGGQDKPIWCAQRFGQSITLLPDGRIVQVAGEHEDHYDPDFCIYNDVFVHSPDGNITVYGFPESLFPPTDFHSATLVGSHICLIGSLGYPGARRYGDTPVFLLDTATFEIERLETSGNKPGWIYKHRADLSNAREIRITGGKILSMTNGKEIMTENQQSFILDLEQRTWRIE